MTIAHREGIAWARLADVDPELWAAIRGETDRQRWKIEMIASENYTFAAVMEAQGSPLTNKYAEGLPGKRYYGGCEFVDVAERLAQASPRSRLVAGGPEVVSGMKLLSRSPFNALVEGEGEEPFCELLGDMARSKPLTKHYAASRSLDLANLPNPYLSGALPFEVDRPVHLETMRGCPMRCAFCCYNLRRRGWSSLPPAEVAPPDGASEVGDDAREAAVEAYAEATPQGEASHDAVAAPEVSTARGGGCAAGGGRGEPAAWLLCLAAVAFRLRKRVTGP